jgi:hypothetical protein
MEKPYFFMTYTINITKFLNWILHDYLFYSISKLIFSLVLGSSVKAHGVGTVIYKMSLCYIHIDL